MATLEELLGAGKMTREEFWDIFMRRLVLRRGNHPEDGVSMVVGLLREDELVLHMFRASKQEK